MRFDWWKIAPHPEWVEPHWSKENYRQPYAAGIPGELRIIFLPGSGSPAKVKQLDRGVKWRAFFFNPATGKEHEIDGVIADANGDWQMPSPPIIQDWICVLTHAS